MQHARAFTSANKDVGGWGGRGWAETVPTYGLREGTVGGFLRAPYTCVFEHIYS